MFTRISLVLGLALASSSAFSQTVKEKKEMAEATKEFMAESADTNKACGTKIAATINWKSFKYDPANSFGVGSAGAYCKDALSGIRQFCEAGAEEKAAVKKAITKYTCNYVAKMSTDDFKKTGMKIGGGGLTVNIHWETGNLYSNVREYLENHL